MLVAAVTLAALGAPGPALGAETPQPGPIYPGLAPDTPMRSWWLLGPFSVKPGATEAPDSDAQKRAFTSDLLSSAGGEADLAPAPGRRLKVGGEERTWRAFQSKSDEVNLAEALGAQDYAAAYAAAVIDAPAETRVLLSIGSDDALKVWLNGKPVHENWVSRSWAQESDLVPVTLAKGTNHLVLKVQNVTGGWGFICRALGPKGASDRLLEAVRGGDPDAVGELLTGGADPNSKDEGGVSAYLAARMAGYEDLAKLLADRGADTKAEPPGLEASVDGLLGSRFKGQSSGAAVLLARDGKVLLRKGYGLANVELGVPVTPETKFRIGSITKQFTAAAILKLQEEGKLSVADKLTKYFPDWPRGDEVTLQHLLTHTSGIHSFTSHSDFMKVVGGPVEPDDVIAYFRNDPYDFGPGERWSYSNSGYFLLGRIVEKVSGKPYGEYLTTTFFQPLGMKDTGVHAYSAILPHEATGYAYEGGTLKKAQNWDMSWAGGAGALYSTVDDLYKWNEALFAGKVLSQESLKAAFTPVSTKQSPGSEENGYGFGWMVSKLRGKQVIGHGGGLNGFVTYAARLPEPKVTVVVLSNAAPAPSGFSPDDTANRMLEACLWKGLAPRTAVSANKQVDPKTYAGLVGRYEVHGLICAVTQEGNHLYGELPGQPRVELVPLSETEFAVRGLEAHILFKRDAKGKATEISMRQGGNTLTARRVEELPDAKIDPAVLDAYVGRYNYGPPGVMTITREGDHLFAQLAGQPKLEIHPVSETEFAWREVVAQITFVKDPSGKVTKAIHQQGGQTIEAPRM
jgi:CubicO group peptidase (beta-lactamase class C family)